MADAHTVSPGVTRRIAGVGRILIVDDITEMRQTLRRMLRWAGVTDVELASNIDEARLALERAKERVAPFDLVLIDQMMPGGSGTELIEEVVARNLVNRRHTGLFLLSGVSEYDLQAQARQAGAVALLEKPISGDNLLAVIQKWAAYRQAARTRASSGGDTP